MIAFEYLFNRRVPLVYTSPAVCDYDFSGTGEPTIYLAPLVRVGAPGGLVFGGVGGFTLSWGIVPGALCYSVYRSLNADDPFGPYQLVAKCLSDAEFTIPAGDFNFYRVEAITEDGVTDLSDPIRSSGVPSAPPVVPGCSPETGEACPEGATAFNVKAEQGEFFETCALDLNPKTAIGVDNPIPWQEYSISKTAMGFWKTVGPTNYFKATIPGDYPPGQYIFRYVDGLGVDAPAGAPPPNNRTGVVAMYFFKNDELVDVSDALVNGTVEVNQDCLSTGETPTGGSGWVLGGPNSAGLVSNMQAYFRSPPNEIFWGAIRQFHSNTGGSFEAVWIDGFGTYDPPAGYELTLQVLQVSGLIQQPRKVQIQSWGSVSQSFPVSIRDYWTGALDTRTEYTLTTCRWDQDASGPFGGAALYYSQSRPEAANGCAWVLEIWNGTELFWEGVKIIGDNPDGLYQGTVVGSGAPSCLRIENKEIWEYPTA